MIGPEGETLTPKTERRLKELFEKARKEEQADGGDRTFEQFVTELLDLYENTLMEL